MLVVLICFNLVTEERLTLINNFSGLISMK